MPGASGPITDRIARIESFYYAMGSTPVMDEPDESQAETLRDEQTRIAQRERQAARDAPTADDAKARDRRAEKAAYLASKLAKRERSEQD